MHRALAEATDPDADPDRRAWHRAHAADGARRERRRRAGTLGRAGRQARGGVAAAAAFLERAAELTPDPAARAARALAAAQAKFEAGAPDAADELLGGRRAGPLDDLQRARLARLRAQIAFARSRGSDAPPLLLDAARRLEPLDADAGPRDVSRGARSGDLRRSPRPAGVGVREAAEAARAAPPAPQPPRATDLLLDGLAARFTEGYAAGVPLLGGRLHAFCGDDGRTRTTSLALAGVPRRDRICGTTRRWHELATRAVRLARDAGALNVLPIALTYRAGVARARRRVRRRAALIDEADAITQATGIAPLRYTSLVLAAWRGAGGRGAGADRRRSLEDATARGEGRAIALADVRDAPCCTTASAATRPRSPRRNGHASTTTWASSAGR